MGFHLSTLKRASVLYPFSGGYLGPGAHGPRLPGSGGRRVRRCRRRTGEALESALAPRGRASLALVGQGWVRMVRVLRDGGGGGSRRRREHLLWSKREPGVERDLKPRACRTLQIEVRENTGVRARTVMSLQLRGRWIAPIST